MRMGPRFRLHGDVNFSSGGDGKWAGGEDGPELIEFAPCDMASCDGIEFTAATCGSPQGSRRMAPPQSSPLPLWHLSLVIYRSDHSSKSFTPKCGVGLQSARDYIASLMDPTGTSDTEVDFVLTSKRHMARGSLSDFWSISSPRPTIVVQYDSYHPTLTIWSTCCSLMFFFLVSTRIPVTIESWHGNVRIVYLHCSCWTSDK